MVAFHPTSYHLPRGLPLFIFQICSFRDIIRFIKPIGVCRVRVLDETCRSRQNSYFSSSSAFIFCIPSRITSLFVLPSFSQQKVRSSSIALSARNFTWIFLGFAEGGRPVRGLTSSPTFCVHLYYITMYILSQALFLRFCNLGNRAALWPHPHPSGLRPATFPH